MNLHGFETYHKRSERLSEVRSIETMGGASAWPCCLPNVDLFSLPFEKGLIMPGVIVRS